MTTDADLDRLIHEYLEAGPAEMSDRLLMAARAELKTTRRRDGRFGRLMPWRDRRMSQRTRILLVAGGALALAIAVGAGALGPFGQRQSGVGSSTPPSGAASAVAASASVASPSASSALRPTPNPTFVPPVVQLGSIQAKEIAPARAVNGWLDASQAAAATTFGTPVIAPDGKIWVPANEQDRIRIYDQNLKLVETWGPPGPGAGEFRFGDHGDPDRGGLVFAPDGSFFVLDSGNARVQRFSADRSFVGSFGSDGTGDGQFVSPNAIGLDDGNNLYVADAGRNDVQVFTTGGAYVRTVAKGAAGSALWGSGPGWFITTRLTDDSPGAIEYHADGTVQGGWDLSPWCVEPIGVTRDQSPRNIYLTCQVASGGGVGYLFRFDQGGALLRAWSVPDRGVAVTADGTRAFTVSENEQVLRRWDLEPPGG